MLPFKPVFLDSDLSRRLTVFLFVLASLFVVEVIHNFLFVCWFVAVSAAKVDICHSKCDKNEFMFARVRACVEYLFLHQHPAINAKFYLYC